jgi:hypothetical protein
LSAFRFGIFSHFEENENFNQIFERNSWKICSFFKLFVCFFSANISQIHDFVRQRAAILQPDEIMQAMAAITECAHILQARKQKDEDIEGIINMSKALSNAQVRVFD